ncbi:NAD(+) diphosphatase [Nakamurella lactea]|uniref:NAD(+) diphosphatase n=1 Tax=Nakamurella lactea TaxID=459515 RepID=UPI0004093234|nr:NAD(+) diphosphatase [Nakamurella lactea]
MTEQHPGITRQGSAGAPFDIELPTLSRGTADRDEDLRVPERMTAAWPDARVLRVGPTGAIAAVDGRPDWQPATGPGLPHRGVLLGVVDGVDHWAIPDVDVEGPTLRELGLLLDDTDAGLLVSAVAVLGWHARGAFCPTCGQPSVPAPDGWSRTCGQGHQEFPRTDPAAIVLVHDGADKMVLASQPNWPKGRFSVLAGFTEAGESLEQTVVREIGEEIGIPVTDVHYLASQPWPFPRSLMIGFAARAEPGIELHPRAGEISEAHWVSRETVRRILAGDGNGAGWAGPGTGGAEIVLSGSISIARRMIEGWAAAG